MRRQLAEWLFERELDEDYFMGLREGQRRVRVTAINNLKQIKETAPKSKQPGLDEAIKLIEGLR